MPARKEILEIGGREVAISNPDKVYFPRAGHTKLDVVRYFVAVADGALVAHTGNGPVTFSSPVAWQEIDGQRLPVRVAYALAGQRYGFKLGDYDHARAVAMVDGSSSKTPVSG